MRSRINTKMGGLEATKLPITGCLFFPISFFVVRCGFQSHTQVSFMHRPPASRVLHFTAYESRYDPEHVDPSPNTIWTKGKTGATQAWLPFFFEKNSLSVCVYTSERIEPANTPLQDRHAQICQVTVFLHFPKFCLEFGQHLWIFVPIWVIFANLFPSLHVCEGWGEGDRLGLLAPAPLHSHFQQGHMTPVKRCHNLTGGELAATNQSKPGRYTHTHTHTQILAFTYLFIWLLQKKCLTYSLCSKPVVCS